MRELGDRGAVGELDHRVHDRLRVHDDLDLVVVDAEQLVGLDHLEALVHQRGRVDVIFGPIVQVGWASASSTVTSASSAARAAAERAAAGGEHDPGDLRGRAPTGPQALVDGAVLGVDRARARRPASARSGCTTGPAAIRHSLLASASRLPARERGERDGQAGEARRRR